MNNPDYAIGRLDKHLVSKKIMDKLEKEYSHLCSREEIEACIMAYCTKLIDAFAEGHPQILVKEFGVFKRTKFYDRRKEFFGERTPRYKSK